MYVCMYVCTSVLPSISIDDEFSCTDVLLPLQKVWIGFVDSNILAQLAGQKRLAEQREMAWVNLVPSWPWNDILGANLGILGSKLVVLDAKLAILVAPLAFLGAKFVVLGANLAVLGASLVVLDANLAVLGANLAVLGVNLVGLGANLAVFGVNLAVESAICGELQKH